MLEEAATLVDLLRWRAQHQPDRRAYTFLADGNDQQVHMSYIELERRARAIGKLLRSRTSPGMRALLLYPPGLDYIAAFFGCLYAGVVAVPAYPPNPSKLQRTLPRLQTILLDARPAVALTTAMIQPMAESLSVVAPEFASLPWLATDTLDSDESAEWPPPPIDASMLAMIQYTSGSTSRPKGVMLTHANLLYNLGLIHGCFGHSLASSGVIWLPPYHDMGLIGGILEPLHGGFPVILMSPMAFLQQPLRWLQAISQYRATTSGGPNFAYDLCVRKTTPEQRATLDLSSWTVAFNGAEPIHVETMERFAETFAPCGFRREAFLPCYGLAEATLIVSGKAYNARPVIRGFQSIGLEHHHAYAAPSADASARQLVGCGVPLDGQQVVVVDPQTRIVGQPDTVGEIWVAGASVAQGYWDLPEETAATFGARLADGTGPFLRTGDLGFLQDGQLFITGRLKDLLIIRGRNYYPQDLEQTVECCHPALRAGCGAAFAVTIGTKEQLVVVNEVERRQQHVDVAEVAAAIRQAIAEEHELQVYAIVLIQPATIPKTSSGKIERHSCRAKFLDASLAEIGRSIIDPSSYEAHIHERIHASSLAEAIRHSAQPEERQTLLAIYLREQLAQVCRGELLDLDPHRSLVAYGLDSLAAVELKNALEVDLGIELPLEQFLDTTTIDQLAAQVLEQLARPASGSAGDTAVRRSQLLGEPRNLDEVQPLSFDQERLWLLDRLDPGTPCYTIPAAVRLVGQLDPDVLRQCLNTIVRRHAILRTSFTTHDGLPVQATAAVCELPFPIVDLSDRPGAERMAELQRVFGEATNHRFELSRAPLLKITLVRLEPGEHVLVLALHHIVADLWSMVVVFRELAALYQASSARQPSPLPALPLQYIDFVHWQRARFQAQESELAYWRTQLADPPPALALPADRARPATRNTAGAYHTFTLARPAVQSIQHVSQHAGVTPFVVLLAAFKLLLHRLANQDDILIGTPIAGRNQHSFEQLIGFFAYPVVLRTDLSGDPTFQELLARVRRVALDAYAHQEVPFAKVVEVAQPARSANHHPLFQVMFGFLSKGWEPISIPDLTLIPISVGRQATDMDLFLTVVNTGEEFCGVVEYSTALFDADTIEQFIAAYCGLLDQCLQAPEMRLSEFALPATLSDRVRVEEQPRSHLLALAATFTAEPAEEALAFWMGELGLPGKISFAPYNQVFQQLLDPTSLLRANRHGTNVILIRLEDWLQGAGAPAMDDRPHPYALVEQQARDFVEALKGAVEHSKVPYIVCLCPLAPDTLADPSSAIAFKQLEGRLAAALQDLSGVAVVTPAALAARYPVVHYYDSYAHKLGSIPFTAAYFAALGTMIARTIFGLYSTPRKVLVLDCDNTLWGGVVGEDGAGGLELTPAYLALQEWAIAQQEAGMLLCLSSKNSPADIDAVFEQRTEMPLRREHITLRRINWQTKSANLRSLAEELNLGLESFILIDDNPVECAEVLAQCPEVLVLQLPEDTTRIPAFLNHVWATDQRAATAEDRQRTQFYQEQQQRDHARAAAASLADFLARLDLVVDIRPMTGEQAPRIAQLTQRTNQFNTTTIRRTESEVARLHQTGDREGVAVWVRDRFGDYGLVGAVLFAAQDDALFVDSFLLSCRALGRGVEYRMLARLGMIAQERGLSQVVVPYTPTPKNQPARDFLAAIHAVEIDRQAGTVYVRLAAEDAARLRYQPDTSAAGAPEPQPASASGEQAARPALLQSEQMRRIALELSDPEDILRVLQQRKLSPLGPERGIAAPRNEIEEALVGIWCELLGVAQVSIDDDFFALGGHSLLAVQMLSRIRDMFGTELPLESLFTDRFSVADLAQAIADAQVDQIDSDQFASLLSMVESLSDDELAELFEAESGSLRS